MSNLHHRALRKIKETDDYPQEVSENHVTIVSQ